MTLDVSEVTKVFPGGHRAVDGVSLRVDRGEALAIVGRNGAGKSTLLRIAAGILAPSSGEVRRSARCASLIDLGMAFHPDLTGRENLELGLAVAGVRGRRAGAIADEVIAFGSLERALGRQVKHFSTGMIARLACAIAVHTAPELILMDEVLAVGDATFQRLMLERVAALRREGAALVLVTHSPELAVAATERAIWLDHGRIHRSDTTEVLIDAYRADATGAARYAARRTVRFTHLQLVPERIEPHGGVQIEATFTAAEPVEPLTFHAEIRPVIGTTETWMRSPDEPSEHRHLNLMAASQPIASDALPAGHHRVSIAIDAIPITPTQLEVSVVACDGEGRVIDHVEGALAVGAGNRRPSYALEASLAPPPSRPDVDPRGAR